MFVLIVEIIQKGFYFITEVVSEFFYQHGVDVYVVYLLHKKPFNFIGIWGVLMILTCLFMYKYVVTIFFPLNFIIKII